MVDVLTQIPANVIAGDSFAWQRELADYPADTWTLTYYFSNGEQAFEIVASADGLVHDVAVTAADTAVYVAGRYHWYARATSGVEAATVESGWLVVAPDPSSGKIDYRSHARKMFEAIELALEGQASKLQLDLISYSLGVVNVSRDRELLIRYRDKYALELQNESGAGGGDPRNNFVRFARP